MKSTGPIIEDLNHLIEEGADYQEVRTFLLEQDVNEDEQKYLLTYADGLIQERDLAEKKQNSRKRTMYVGLLLFALGLLLVYFRDSLFEGATLLGMVITFTGIVIYLMQRITGYHS